MQNSIMIISSEEEIGSLPKESGIYMFKSLINGKTYIGQASNLKNRLSYSLRDIKRGIYHNPILQAAWIKHEGFKGFEIQIIEICSRKELDSKEIAYIIDYNSLSINNGYNIYPGGSQCDKRVYKQRKVPIFFQSSPIAMYSYDGQFIQAFQNMTEGAQHLNTTVSKLYLMANSFGRLEFGQNKNRFIYIKNNFYPQRIYPKPFSYSSLGLLLYSREGQFIAEFDTAASLSKKLDCNVTSIVSVLLNTAPTVKGFVVKYKWNEKYPLLIKPIVYKNPERSSSSLGPVNQIDNNGNVVCVHKNVRQASKLFSSNGQSSVIMNALIGNTKSAYGFKWKFATLNKYNEPKPVFQSTKILDGFSTCFRQWRADHSSCSLAHGYSVSFKIWFEGELDDKNWVQDYGSFKRNGVKEQLAYWFDHSFVAAIDDPSLSFFIEGAKSGVLDLRLMSDVGCERYAELVLNLIDNIVVRETEGRVRVNQVECFENQNNSSIYIRPK